MLSYYKLVAVFWLLLMGAVFGEFVHPPENAYRDFFPEVSVSNGANDLKTSINTREIWFCDYEVAQDMAVYAYCHNDPINKVDVLGLFEVVTTDANGNDVGINSNFAFWAMHQAMFPRKPAPFDPLAAPTSRQRVPFNEAVQVSKALGGSVRYYDKRFPMSSTLENSPSDLWILPQRESFSGEGRGYGDSFMARMTQMTLGFGDVADYRTLVGVSEANAQYPWGSLSSAEISSAMDRNYVFDFWDMPLASPSDANLATFAHPLNGLFAPQRIPGESNGMRLIPGIGSMREFRNAAVLELVTLGTFKGFALAARSTQVATSGVRVTASRQYSTAFEMQLDLADFGRSRAVHFNRANAALDNALSADAALAGRFDKLIPGVHAAVSKTGGRQTPVGWVWEHASRSTTGGREGIMRLVPGDQHTPGSIFWRTLHPDRGAAGGYSQWAIPRGAPPN